MKAPIEEFKSDCSDYFRKGHRTDGIYEIQITDDPSSRFNVYCNMTAGGWTVIMKREERITNVDFYLDIQKYKFGFGDINANHFIGDFFLKI